MKRSYKRLISVIIGVIICVTVSYLGVCAAPITSSKDVTYDNTTSKLTSKNMQGAIDELYEKANSNFAAVFSYNEDKSASNYCVTGEESTCQINTCYKEKTVESCQFGTIILYKVNDKQIIPFYVMHDDGKTIKLLSQKDILTNIGWYGGEGENPNDIKGPRNLLTKLEKETADWSNVNNQTYNMGRGEPFGKTGCSEWYSCTDTTYTMPDRINVKARMITMSEVRSNDCTSSSKSCPKFMYNYITETVKENHLGVSWTMNTTTDGSNNVYAIDLDGKVISISNTFPGSVRAVVEVSK